MPRVPSDDKAGQRKGVTLDGEAKLADRRTKALARMQNRYTFKHNGTQYGSINEWARKHGLPEKWVHARRHAGWSFDKMLATGPAPLEPREKRAREKKKPEPIDPSRLPRGWGFKPC